MPAFRKILGFFLLSLVAQADVAQVRAQLPSVYRAAAETLGQGADDRLEELFRGWGTLEIAYVGAKLRGLHRALEADQSTDVFPQFHRKVKETLGEVVGLVSLRRSFSSNFPATRVIDEPTYRSWNSGGRPDGLVIEVRGARLTIHRILESKLAMAGGGMNWAQVAAYVAHWRQNGMRIDTAYFAPDAIEFVGEIPVALTELVSATTTKDEAMRLAPWITKVSSGTRPARTAVAYERVLSGLSHEEITRIATLVTMAGTTDQSAVTARRDLLDAANRARFAPVQTWMRTHGRWPRQTSSDDDEAYWGRWVNINGRQRGVWNHLDADVRAMFEVRMTIEPLRVLEEWIAVHGEAPTVSSDDEEERRLGVWIANAGGQEAALRRLGPSGRALFPVRLLLEPIALLDEWIEDQERWPSHSGFGDEKKLATWVSNHGNRIGVYEQLSEDNRALDAVLLGVDWYASLNLWVRDHGCLPSQGKVEERANRDSLEAKLAFGIQNRGGHAAVFAQLTDENRALLPIRLAVEPAAVLAEFRRDEVVLTDDQVFEARLQVEPLLVLNEWVRGTGEFPSTTSPVSREKRLAKRVGRFGNRQVLFSLLDADNQTLFFVRVAAYPEALYAEWVATRKPPSKRSSDPREKRLGNWAAEFRKRRGAIAFAGAIARCSVALLPPTDDSPTMGE